MRFSIFATALAAAVLCTSAAWSQVRSFVYSASNGGVSKATVDITSRDGSRGDAAALSISQRGGSADATVNADAKRGAHVIAGAEVTRRWIPRPWPSPSMARPTLISSEKAWPTGRARVGSGPARAAGRDGSGRCHPV
jgi:hypothetical protein